MAARARRVLGVPVRRLHCDVWRLAALAIGLAFLGLGTGLNSVAAADPTPAAAGEFVPLTAASLVKTTSAIGWSGKVQPGATKSVAVTGVSGVPGTGVLAVMLHITTS